MSSPAASLPGGAQRVLIYGVTGSGKSTLALQLGTLTGIAPHLVDEEIGWLPNWQERPPEEQRRLAAALAAEESWILDSVYGKFRDVVVPRTELIIGLDYSRARTLIQLVRRTARRVIEREPICNGNVETLRQTFSKDSILVWHFRSFSQKRRTMRDFAAQAAADPSAPRAILFSHPGEKDRWLASLTEVSR
ncbi:adenylate kinase [Psychromicrobium sp. YIM B11713]|uniref:adenylate kinase n=1 Tax=Psychromicrobium sp. YIM B11713 TaxID=3145233 RepID=UPI00374F5233